MAFDIIGKLHRVFDVESKTSSFQTREFVIEVPNDRYPEYVKFQLTQDRCTLIDAFQTGDTIKVFFDLKGREWQGKYFTNLSAWKVEAGSNGGKAAAPANNGREISEFPDTDLSALAANDTDDLPF